MPTFPHISLAPVLGSLGDASFVLDIGHGAVWMLVAIFVASFLGILREAMRKETVLAPVAAPAMDSAASVTAPAEHRAAA